MAKLNVAQENFYQCIKYRLYFKKGCDDFCCGAGCSSTAEGAEAEGVDSEGATFWTGASTGACSLGTGLVWTCGLVGDWFLVGTLGEAWTFGGAESVWIWPCCAGSGRTLGWAFAKGGVWGLGWSWGLEFLRTGGTGFGGSGFGTWGFGGKSVGFPGAGVGEAWGWALGCWVVGGGVGEGVAFVTGSGAGALDADAVGGSWVLGWDSLGFAGAPRV